MEIPFLKSQTLEESVHNLSVIANNQLTTLHGGADDQSVVEEFLKMPHLNKAIRPDLMVIANLAKPIPFLYEKNYSLDLGTETNSYAEMTRYIEPDTIRLSDLMDRKVVEFMYTHKLQPFDFVYRFCFEVDCPNTNLKRLRRTVFFIAANPEGGGSHCVVYIHNLTDQVSKFRYPGYEISFVPEKQHLTEEAYSYISQVLPAPHDLTPRECEVIQLLDKGLSSKMIALDLGLSKHTVDTYRRKLLKKLGVKNTAGILGKAREIDII